MKNILLGLSLAVLLPAVFCHTSYASRNKLVASQEDATNRVPASLQIALFDEASSDLRDGGGFPPLCEPDRNCFTDPLQMAVSIKSASALHDGGGFPPLCEPDRNCFIG